MIDRKKLQEQYVESVVDNMDIQDLCMFVYEAVNERLNAYTDDELVDEVESFYPQLLED